MRASPALRLTAVAGTALLAGPMLAGPTAAAELPTISATYAVGSGPQGLAITPDGRSVVTANQGSNNATIIDLRLGSVTNVAGLVSPVAVAVSPDSTRAYVSNWDLITPSVETIDIASASSLRRTTVGARPWNLAISGDGATLLVSSSFNGPLPPPSGPLVSVQEVAHLQTSNGSVRATSSVSGARLIVAAPDGTQFTVLQAGVYGLGRAAFLVAGTSATRGVTLQGYNPVDAVFSPDSRTAYFASNSSSDSANLAVVDVASASVTSATGLASDPRAVAISPDGSRVFVTLGTGSGLAVFDAGGTRLSTTALAGTTDRVEVSPAGYVLVTTTEGDLHVLDATGTRLLTTLAVGGQATDLEVAASGSFAALSIGTTNRVIVVNLPPVPASGAEVPTAALQQYAPTDGSPCGTNAPDAVDFPGIAQLRTEGWSASWAQWPNEGRGGAVCTRQPYYTAAGTWAVR